MPQRPNIYNLKIVQHNVRNWTTNSFAFSNIYNSLNPDIILINEHSIKTGNSFKIFNYNTIYSNKKNEYHSGSAIAIRKNITYRLHDNFYTDFLAITIETIQGNITIATTYNPPRDDFLNYIDFHTLLHDNKPTIILADLNARHTHFNHNRSNHTGKQLYKIMKKYNLTHQGPDFPTFIGPAGTGTPDTVLTNSTFHYNIHLTPGPLTPSDHIPIIAKISTSLIQHPIKPRYQFHKTDWDSYKTILSNFNLQMKNNATTNDIDLYIEQWTNAIVDATNQTTPIIYNRAIPGVRPDNTILQLQADYNRLIQNITIHGPSIDKYRQLHRLQTTIQQVYRDRRATTWDQIINDLDLTDDPTQFWKTIKKLQGSNRLTTPYMKDNDGRQYHSDTEKEQLFRHHFIDIFTDDGLSNNDFTDEIDEHMTAIDDITAPFITADINRLRPSFPPITLAEFTKTLKTFKNKAPGPSNIKLHQLQNLPPNMTHYLITIFNLSISLGYFPKPFKKAIMILIPKTNINLHQTKNYRPISLLDIQGKILDKILNNRLNSKLQQQGKINIRQHGFRANRGTHTAIATLNETIARDIRLGNNIDLVFRDVAKAFDKVWHNGLKFKLTLLGLDDCMTKTLCNYLDDRHASIRLNNHLGPTFPLKTGVPQGACLSPTLYSYFTHDMPDPLPKTDYILFADDVTQIISTKDNFKYLGKLTERAIGQINDYERQWKIRTNVGKFNLINLGRTKTATVRIGNTIVPYKREGKVLGLTINRLGFTPQIQQRKAIAHSKLNKLYRFRDLNQNTKKLLYTSTVRSALLYPTIPLHTISKSQMIKLQRLQNKGIRFITGNRLIDKIPSQTLHQQTNLDPINIHLHNLANNTWNNIQINNPSIYNSFPIQTNQFHNTKSYFPSSKKIALGHTPIPIYK